MSYDKYQYTVLCEDRPQYNFVRGWLLARGVQKRGERIKPYDNDYPPHAGSGKEYVRNNLENALKVLARKAGERRILIVMIDADNLPPGKAEKTYLPSAAPDNVFLITPRWSIETWARWLLEPTHDKALDESETCKTRYVQAPFTDLGKQLSGLMKNSQAELPPMPASLFRAIQRIQNWPKG